MSMPYPRSTSGCSTTIPPKVVPHSISLLCLSHPSLPFHSLTPVLLSLSHLSPLPFSSPTTCATSALACVAPTTSSQPSCLLHLAIAHRAGYHCDNHPTIPSSMSVAYPSLQASNSAPSDRMQRSPHLIGAELTEAFLIPMKHLLRLVGGG
jgi:hypothetical protein